MAISKLVLQEVDGTVIRPLKQRSEWCYHKMSDHNKYQEHIIRDKNIRQAIGTKCILPSIAGFT